MTETPAAAETAGESHGINPAPQTAVGKSGGPMNLCEFDMQTESQNNQYLKQSVPPPNTLTIATLSERHSHPILLGLVPHSKKMPRYITIRIF